MITVLALAALAAVHGAVVAADVRRDRSATPAPASPDRCVGYPPPVDLATFRSRRARSAGPAALAGPDHGARR